MEAAYTADKDKFQSTPSVWRETGRLDGVAESALFQSTPSVWRETLSGAKAPAWVSHFNPLPPCGGRRRI